MTWDGEVKLNPELGRVLTSDVSELFTFSGDDNYGKASSRVDMGNPGKVVWMSTVSVCWL